jgi:hypothetical protein
VATLFSDPSYRLASESGVAGKLAREELNLLAKLIGTAETQDQDTFRINLFDPDFGEDQPVQYEIQLQNVKRKFLKNTPYRRSLKTTRKKLFGLLFSNISQLSIQNKCIKIQL